MVAFRRYFLTGILAILPLGISAWVLYKVFITVDSNVSPLIARWIGHEIPGVGFAATVVFIFLVGLFASNIIGRTIIRRFEAFFAKVPLFSRIYAAVKQIGDAVIGIRKNLFERVVMVEWPGKGIWSLGFVTAEETGEVARRTGKRITRVFVPTTPNPTSGFLLFLPEEDIFDAHITVEDGIKLVISGGAVSLRTGAAPASSEDAVEPSAVAGSAGS